MEAFDYSPLAGRVVFGSGTIARVAAEVEALGCSRAFVLSDLHHAAGAALRVRDALQHDPKKWMPVFGKDHAQTIS